MRLTIAKYSNRIFFDAKVFHMTIQVLKYILKSVKRRLISIAAIFFQTFLYLQLTYNFEFILESNKIFVRYQSIRQSKEEVVSPSIFPDLIKVWLHLTSGILIISGSDFTSGNKTGM